MTFVFLHAPSWLTPNILKRVESEAPEGFPGFPDPLLQRDYILLFSFKGDGEEGRKVLGLCQNNHLTSKTCLSVSSLWNFLCMYWRVQFFHKTQYYVRGTDKCFQLDPEIANAFVEDWQEITTQVPKSPESPWSQSTLAALLLLHE